MKDSQRYNLASYIDPLDTVARSDAGETLGTVLPLANSSHTPVLIFSKDNEFLGIISPYQSFYLHKYPYTTKVFSLIIKPPFITVQTPLWDIASFMLASRVYVLPIFSNEREIEGVIHIKKILDGILKDPELLTYLSSSVKPRRPVTAHINASVGDIFRLMSVNNVSRVVLVDDEGHLAGIVSRRDLLKAFMEPTPKQRFGKNGFQPTDWAFDEEKRYRKITLLRLFLSNGLKRRHLTGRLKRLSAGLYLLP
jgi:CBS domain-containing protein